MTLGASMIAAVATVATAPPAVRRNRRRFVVTPLSSSRRHELVVGALGDVIPRAHQRLELRERRVHLPGHRGLLGFVPDDFGGQLPEIAQHGSRKLDYLDLALELRLELREGD